MMVLTIASLLQTIVIHYYYTYKGDENFALTLDKTIRLLLNLVLFPATVVALLMFAQGGSLAGVGVALLVVAAVLCLVAGPLHVHYQLRTRRRHREEVLLRLRASSRHTPLDGGTGDGSTAMSTEAAREAALRAAFELYDEDQDGSLDATELNQLLRQLNYDVPRKAVTRAMRTIRTQYMGKNETITFDELVDGMDEMHALVWKASVVEESAPISTAPSGKQVWRTSEPRAGVDEDDANHGWHAPKVSRKEGLRPGPPRHSEHDAQADEAGARHRQTVAPA